MENPAFFKPETFEALRTRMHGGNAQSGLPALAGTAQIAASDTMARVPQPVIRLTRSESSAGRRLQDGNAFAPDWALEDFLHASDTGMFAMDAVRAEMEALARNAGTVWVWRPLRQHDDTISPWRHAYEKFHTVQAALVREPYPLAVPEDVWRIVFEIENGFAAQHTCSFFVSHYENLRPDPFLAVTAAGRVLHVIAQWPEPGRHAALRGKPPPRVTGPRLRFPGWLRRLGGFMQDY